MGRTTTKGLAAGGGIAACDAIPAGHELGGVKPRVKSRADVALALRVISWICSRRETVEASLEQRVNLLREEAKADLQLEVGAETVTFDDREQALRAAVSKYVLAKKAEIFENGSQTAKFPSGKVAWRNAPPTIKFEEDVTPRSIVDALLAEHTLMSKALSWLKRQGVLPWLKVSFALDVTSIKQAAKAEAISAEQLAVFGIRYEGEEVVTITPADYTAASDGVAEGRY